MNFQPDSVQTMIVDAVDEVAPKSGIVGVAPVSCGAFIYDGFFGRRDKSLVDAFQRPCFFWRTG